MAKNPFKEGDRVYVHPYGWGEVLTCGTSSITFRHQKECEGEFRNVHINGVSFTEYDLVNGGWSHDRPAAKASCKINGNDLVLPPKSNSGMYFTPEEPSVELNYRRFIDDALDVHDIIGFNMYKDLIETTDKNGGAISHVPTDRVTLSIDLVKRA